MTSDRVIKEIEEYEDARILADLIAMDKGEKPLPTLYIRDSKGKVRQWRVWTEGADVVVEHGLQGGKLQTKRTTCKAKNVGKANATTPEEQAALEARSKWTKQVQREDYHSDVERSGRQVRPMLALDYTKVPHRVDWSQAVAQPKLDGLRLTAGRRYPDQDGFEMMTRKGETYHVPHIEEQAKLLLTVIQQHLPETLALDGELYLHGMPLPKITSLARKYQPGETDQLEYHLFDLVAPGIPYRQRALVLEGVLYSQTDHSVLKSVPRAAVGQDTLDELHGQFIEQGYEGVILRHTDGAYAIGQRSPDLFKYKQFKTEEFRIVDVWADKNGNAMFTCEVPDGRTFGSTPKRTHAERKAILADADAYVGQWVTVKFIDYTPDGIPGHNVALGLRECDDEGNPIT